MHAAQRSQGQATPATLDYAALIKDVGRGIHGVRDLDAARAERLFAAMLAGEVPELELGALLLAYRIKGEALAEALGFLAALCRDVARVAVPDDAPRPVVLPTYNGARRLPNLTALVALMLRQYGVPVLLHGLPRGDDADDFGRVTTRDVLGVLGFLPATSLKQAEAQLARDRLAYVPVDLLAPGLARLLATRARLGVRSSAHSLAKLIDPFGGEGLRVVAVTHPDYLARMRELLVATHARALLFRGTEGEPFANPRRQPRIERFSLGAASVALDADEGPPAAPPALPATVDAATTAAWISDAMTGSVPIPLPIVNQVACCLA